MIYGSVCSGIEAATVAWHGLGWNPAFFSEIEDFPRAVLEHHYPEVPLHGDFTTIKEKQYGPIDLLVGGTPCQSFSINGLREGVGDDRGNLALEFVRLAQREQPQWILWENVPGVLSSNGGRDFGSILGALAHIGYGFSYRVLDSQYFGTPQRRRRVFVVGYLGDWRPPAAVLFERESLSGNPAPSREAREEATRGSGGVAYGLKSGNTNSNGIGVQKEATHTLNASDKHAVASNRHIRRLTPKECERLQGFPDDYTQITYRNKEAENCPKGLRYKAMGNSMAVPVMRWIGERIQQVTCERPTNDIYDEA
jgi:DNA (cytosine-5)-methyltransferase 1